MNWDVDAHRLHEPRRKHDASLYLGRYSDPMLEGSVDLIPMNHELPTEASQDGCPGGWYRTAYASSVLKYRRARTDGGGRVDHGLLRDASPQVWVAVRELEREEERAHAYASERGREIADRAAKSPKKGAGSRGR